MPDFSQLSPLMQNLHAETVKLYYMMLPGFFALAIALQWFKRSNGAVDFFDIMKRAIVSTLLLVGFPEITDVILNVADGVAAHIDSVRNLDKFNEIAQQKLASYTNTPSSILLHFGDMVLCACTFLSFLFLFFARFVSLAAYHFSWLFLIVMAPLLLLFNLFASTAQITANLFRGLIEVACWKIVWALLGVMLASLTFGKMYLLEGSYPTVIVMNLVVAIAVLATPLLVRSLASSGAHAMSPLFTASAVAAIPKIANVGSMVAAKPLFRRGEGSYSYGSKGKANRVINYAPRSGPTARKSIS